MQAEIARQDGRTASAKGVLWGTLGQQDTASASVYALGIQRLERSAESWCKALSCGVVGLCSPQ